MKHVLVAGATGYLGRYLCSEFRSRGWHVSALARKAPASGDLDADRILLAQATWPESLRHSMADTDLVVSALGITRQADGVGYWDVDYQGNLNLLDEALRSMVPRFAYVHVLNADRMGQVPMVAAKSAFVRKLQSARIASTVIAPTGYFSDMADFLAMARSGRVWMFGHGEQRINPIHGADLATAVFNAVRDGLVQTSVGGPETFTLNDLAALAFETLGTQPRITRLPEALRRLSLWALPRLAPRRVAGPAQFFLTASAMNMTAPATGSRRLAAFFQACDLAQSTGGG